MIATSSTYPCQSVGQWVSQGVIYRFRFGDSYSISELCELACFSSLIEQMSIWVLLDICSFFRKTLRDHCWISQSLTSGSKRLQVDRLIPGVASFKLDKIWLATFDSWQGTRGKSCSNVAEFDFPPNKNTVSLTLKQRALRTEHLSYCCEPFVGSRKQDRILINRPRRITQFQVRMYMSQPLAGKNTQKNVQDSFLIRRGRFCKETKNYKFFDTIAMHWWTVCFFIAKKN